MKKTLLIFAILFSVTSCYADTPYIPEHLTNPNYDFKNQKIDCEKELKYAHPFIPATVPAECSQYIYNNNNNNNNQTVQENQNSNVKTTTTKKIGKFVDKLLSD